ncbi:MAG: hypothetical protein AB1414_16145 [bacterium]
MFWCWSDIKLTKGLIGFENSDIIFDFRDELSDNFSITKGLIVKKQENKPTKCDSIFKFFLDKSKKEVEKFYNKKIPNPIEVMFKTKNCRCWKEEWNKIIGLVKVEIETSHDFPCLIITTFLHTPDELSMEIKKVAKKLEIELYENSGLENINDVIMSNRTFGEE